MQHSFMSLLREEKHGQLNDNTLAIVRPDLISEVKCGGKKKVHLEINEIQWYS